MTAIGRPSPLGFGAARDESREEACRALVHFLQTRRSAWTGGHGEMRRSLLIADYARRSRGLPGEQRAEFDRQVVESFLPYGSSGQPQSVPRVRKANDVVDVAVLTVLREELDAALQAFGLGDRPYETAGQQRFYRAQVPTHNRTEPLSVIITAAGEPLNVHINRSLDVLLQRYTPRAVFLLGIAAGIPEKVGLGDVVVSRRVFYYEPARLAEGSVAEPRPQHEKSADAYGSGIFHYDPERTDYREKVAQFLRELTPDQLPEGIARDHCPRVFTDNVTIAAGEAVMRDGRFLPDLRQRFDNTILAADQESYGFARTAQGLPWLIFRGISDYGDAEQHERWKQVAPAFAALCLEDFLSTQYLPPGIGDF